MTDDVLIKQCQKGDDQAFETLLGLYYDQIHSIAYQWCQDSANAQDITQLVCIKLAKSIQQFNFESSFTTWLYRLVINCAKDFYKSPSQYNVREESDYDFDEHTGRSEDLSSRTIYAQQILEHIASLQEDLRDTLVLVYGAGLNHRQTAERLGVKESTISWRVHAARKLLKDSFSTPLLRSNSSAEQSGGLV
jgi:RNA polymerase sigma-70 factor (ECF subfamily)